MDPKVLKKTQDTLGKLIKKPPLTEKLLGKPPFRFLHDVMTSVIKTTGFMQGLYSDGEMNSENVKDKDAKIAFLQKAIDMVSAVTGKSLNVKPVKIVAGHEPERTNEFLQALADAINKNVDNDAFVKQVLKGGGGGGGSPAKEEKHESHKDREKEKDRDRTKSADRRKHRDSEKHEKEKDGERSRDKGDRERSRDKGDRDRDRERKHEKDRDRHKDRESKTRDKSRDDREERHREKSKKRGASPSHGHKPSKDAKEVESRHSKSSSNSQKPNACAVENVTASGPGEPSNTLAVAMGDEGGSSQGLPSPHKHRNSVPALAIGPCCHPDSKLPPPLSSHAESLATGDHSFIGLSDHKEKENESLDREKVNGEKAEKQDAPSRLQRPSSAKGSRRRREEDEEFQKPMAPSADAVLGEGDLPPQVAAARQLARPSSARPAPPRPKQDVLESEPAMRLGGGQPANLIVDNDNDEDEDENFLVEETAPPPPEVNLTPSKPADEEDAEHGALVKKMLESKKELEGGNQNQTKKTEIERPVMSDAQRRKQREQVQKEVDKLRGSIQSLTRSANPLGKVMDYVQEDLDAMQQELDKWRSENAQHALDLKREMNVTDRAIEPLRQQLVELERAIGDQLGQIAATKSSIIRNDQKIQKMLRGISGS
ncbi:hypothetical protein EGW08_001926 [Elysia chlorotica]|uniref:TRAF3-interacting protein 1 n=1 Tax=Elysia chlorotica TaxID=188477 RepID=A0A3S1AFB7_ELYCH|nr:hypothetical protein EGW08_001926 [Elysia chlorotica]